MKTSMLCMANYKCGQTLKINFLMRFINRKGVYVYKKLISVQQIRFRLSAESNKPLLTQLEHLQEEIKKQQHEIITVRSNILRNELRIKELLNA